MTHDRFVRSRKRQDRSSATSSKPSVSTPLPIMAWMKYILGDSWPVQGEGLRGPAPPSLHFLKLHTVELNITKSKGTGKYVHYNEVR